MNRPVNSAGQEPVVIRSDGKKSRWPFKDYSLLPFPPEVNRAWAAGLWDGEGCTSLKSKTFIRMSLSQAHTGPEILDRLEQILGVGKVIPRLDRPGVWLWRCQDKYGCYRALQIMWPYLSSPKQVQAIRCGYDPT